MRVFIKMELSDMDVQKRLNILFISAKQSSNDSMSDILTSFNHRLTHYISCEKGIASLRATPDIYDLIMIDIVAFANDAIETVKMVRMMEDLLKETWRPIVLLTDGVETKLIIDGLHAGADDFLASPFNKELVEAKLIATNRLFGLRKSHSEQYNQLQKESLTDVLTGISNRRHFKDILKKEMVKAQRHDRAMCIAYFDLDHFKAINDGLGHDAGDEVLRKVSSAISETLRAEDSFGRLGGEEFCICMPDTSLNEALIPAERYRLMIEKLTIEYNNKPINVTASFGVTEFKPFLHDINSLLAHADEALYKSKHQGRNQVTLLPYSYFEKVACSEI